LAPAGAKNNHVDIIHGRWDVPIPENREEKRPGKVIETEFSD
jgi:hypothetical protein